ncbi:MAG: dTMP kinase [Halothiobacillus sp. 24-54-40]|jgi:dTMP kinase|nr:dTMP kinase [Halothiobacillaceae bacterium]OYV47625.1 MAG: dTMP kinase [Halothiobacillus sp. 20-53-49]OYY34676.1 MAG: dTMP kinase [Halothiobacillus sp. 35-54-62]OYZ86388.1 MAG: dTMP kinase [Halothiobacillus sp. 24-54-40]OZA79936.1 MAG: dTMP kinase [Halothiobacillus sp. 39-53-45]HQS02653.1 dTMP kinase [Halothiobacillus sp.]
MSHAGIFITLEGVEGAGKSTAVAGVAAWFSQRGCVVECSREPGGTPLAESMRQILLTPTAEALAEPAELMLLFAARAQHVAHRIKPALAAGKVLICDRFTDSSRAYQGAGRGMDQSLIETLATAAEQGLEPNLTLLLDLPVAEGLARAAARRGLSAHDRFERESADFFERIRAEFLHLAAQHPRFAVIDAAAPLVAVQAQIHAVLQARFPLIAALPLGAHHG